MAFGILPSICIFDGRSIDDSSDEDGTPRSKRIDEDTGAVGEKEGEEGEDDEDDEDDDQARAVREALKRSRAITDATSKALAGSQSTSGASRHTAPNVTFASPNAMASAAEFVRVTQYDASNSDSTTVQIAFNADA